jgi:hypothetical protein
LGGGGGGWKISKNNFLQPKEKEKKNHAAYNREKNISCKRERSKKKIPACKSTDVLHFSIVSTGLQDFAFLSRHICLKEHGVRVYFKKSLELHILGMLRSIMCLTGGPNDV